MALYKQFDKTFAKRLKGYVKEKANNFAVEMSEDIAKAFVNQAKKRLLSNSTPKGPEDSEKIQAIADSIHYTKKGNKCTIVVPNDKEGLNVFLEYGTGLEGKENKNPDAKKIGWDYAINEDSYKEGRSGPNSPISKGFVFWKGDSYINMSDVNPLYKYSYKHIPARVSRTEVSAYTDKNGVYHSSYYKTNTRREKVYEYHYYYDKYVLSSGIKPVRYIYSTRVNLNRIIGQFKNKPKGYIGLRRRLKELQK